MKKTLCVIGGVVAAIAGLVVVNHLWFPSYSLPVTLYNASSGPVEVGYSGSMLERGTVRLVPGQAERVVVYRGESWPGPDYAFTVRVRRPGGAETHTLSLAEATKPIQAGERFLHKRVVIGDGCVVIEATERGDPSATSQGASAHAD